MAGISTGYGNCGRVFCVRSGNGDAIVGGAGNDSVTGIVSGGTVGDSGTIIG